MSTTHVNKLSDEQQCDDCDSKQNLCLCITCKYIGCNHLEYDHIFAHFVKTEHKFSLSLTDMYVYDLSLGKRVNDGQAQAVAFQLQDVMIEKYFKKSVQQSEKIHGLSENIEDDQPIHDQYLQKNEGCESMVEIRKKETDQFRQGVTEELWKEQECLINLEHQYAQERITNEQLRKNLIDIQADVQVKNTEFVRIREDLTKETSKNQELKTRLINLEHQYAQERITNEQLRKNLIDIQADVQVKNTEFVRIRQDLTKETSKNQRLQKCLGNLQQQCAQEKSMNEELRKNQIDLKRDLAVKTTEIEQLKEQMRDVMFHLDAEQKLKQLEINDELQSSQIVVAASKGGRKKRK